MLTAEQLDLLDRLPLRVLANLIADYASDEMAMTTTTFVLAMSGPMRTAKPLDVFDRAVERIRERVRVRSVSAG